MSDAWKALLDRHPEISHDRLLAYLEGRLDEKESHEVERLMADSAFMSEAMEGLAQVGDRKKLSPILAELNRELQRSVGAGKGKGRGRTAAFPGWLLLATLLIVALAVLGYIVYRMYTSP